MQTSQNKQIQVCVNIWYTWLNEYLTITTQRGTPRVSSVIIQGLLWNHGSISVFIV